jgi:hypothetical protein
VDEDNEGADGKGASAPWVAWQAAVERPVFEALGALDLSAVDTSPLPRCDPAACRTTCWAQSWPQGG